MSIENSKDKLIEAFKANIPENILELIFNYSLSIFFAVLLFLVGRWLSRKVVVFIGKVLRKIEIIDETFLRFLENIIYYSLITIVILLVLNNLGVKTSSFLAIIGAAGLAVGLALKDSLGNFASGVIIVFFKPFKVGDNVTAAGVSGVVTEVTIFSTIFTTADNQKIIVPNGAITKSSIVNINANDTRRIDIVVSISYEDSIKYAKDILEDILNKNQRVLKDKTNNIFVSELATSSVNFTLQAWVKSSDFTSVKAELLEEIKVVFDEKGITIPYPKQDVYQYNKN